MNTTRISWRLLASLMCCAALLCAPEHLLADVQADINGNINTDTRIPLDPQEITRTVSEHHHENFDTQQDSRIEATS